ncbi:hypothetical protein [Parabacteroides sp.]
MKTLLLVILKASTTSDPLAGGLMLFTIGVFFCIYQFVIKKNKEKTQNHMDFRANTQSDNINGEILNDMEKAVKCPHCGGNRAKVVESSYKCLYCGSTFFPISEVKPEEVQTTPTVPQFPTTSSPNVNVTVNVKEQGYNNNDTANSFAKGAAGGAGIVAGGCLTVSAMYLAGPIIFFLVLLSMCS